MKLTPHEEKILNIVKDNPSIVTDPVEREVVAKKHGLTEKTLRNRIAELKKRDIIDKPRFNNEKERKPLITENDEINIRVIWEILLGRRSVVTKFALFFTLIGLTYSLIATIYFESKISL